MALFNGYTETIEDTFYKDTYNIKPINDMGELTQVLSGEKAIQLDHNLLFQVPQKELIKIGITILLISILIIAAKKYI